MDTQTALSMDQLQSKPHLLEYLNGKKCTGFEARPQYFQDGDFITYFFSDEIAYEDRIDSVVTIYRSMATKEMVGCKIKSIHHILNTLKGWSLLRIQDGKIFLAVLFLGAAVENPDRKEEYRNVSKRFGNVAVDPHEIGVAA